MYQDKKILAIVPARGGSKGVKRKNIRELSGKPLIAWTIEQAVSCKYIDKVIVSTDDNEIANISEKYGAEVPFLRPKDLSLDKSKMVDVVLHALSVINKGSTFYDLFMLLQPTSPLRTIEDIAKSIESLFELNAKAILGICEVDHHPVLTNTLPENGCMGNFLSKELQNTNRQELPIYYRINGAMYLAYCDYYMKHKSFYSEQTYAYIMPHDRSVDIDSEIDFKLAEFLLENNPILL